MTNPFNWELKSHLLQPIADYPAVWQCQGQAWLMTKTFSQLKGARRQSSVSSQSADGRWRRNYWLVLTERSSDCSKEFQAASRSVKFWLNDFCQPQQRFTELEKSRKSSFPCEKMYFIQPCVIVSRSKCEMHNFRCDQQTEILSEADPGFISLFAATGPQSCLSPTVMRIRVIFIIHDCFQLRFFKSRKPGFAIILDSN